MKMDKEMMYEVPEVQVLAVSVEKGYEVSDGTTTGSSDSVIDYGGGGD